MSYNNTIPTLFLIVALLYATTTPLAHATLATSLTATGQLYCTANGNGATGSVGVPGATVTLRCPGPVSITPTNVATTMTDVAGNFVFANVALTPFTLSSNCVVIVQLPLPAGTAATACPLLANATARVLMARVRLVDNGIFTGTAIGVAGRFS